MSVVTATILSNGEKMPDTFLLLAIETRKEVNQIPTAQLTLIDGDVAQQKFSVSDSDFFKLGREIEIKLRYESRSSSESTVFKGIVVGQRIAASTTSSRLTVTLKDKTLKMTSGRQHAVYREQSDSDVVKKLIGKHSLSVGSVDASATQHRELLQYNASDWDFMLLRSQLNGWVVAVDDGKVSAVRPNVSAAPSTKLSFGFNIYAFDLRLDGREQRPALKSAGWDDSAKALSDAAQGQSFDLSQGNVTPSAAAEQLGFDAATLIDPVSLDPDTLQTWSDGDLIYRGLTLLRGTLTIAGNGSLKPLQTVRIEGVGDRFNGTALVTGVAHTVDEGGWQTVVQLGLSAERFAERTDISPPPAAGHLPAVYGLQIGIVAPYEEPPEGQQRIRVTLPTLPEADGPVWARLLLPDAGAGRGVVFLPEPDDQVIVGFLNDDPREAVVLGSVFNSPSDMPAQLPSPSEENIGKGIVTKEGLALLFLDNEGTPSLVIQTPAGNTLRLDDDGATVELSDQNDNTITLSSDGIAIKSSADVTIEAGGDVKIKGSSIDMS